MRTCLSAIAIVMLFVASASASPLCVADSLAGFINQTATGCSVGPAVITDLYAAVFPTDPIVHPFPTGNISVVPTASGLTFNSNAVSPGGGFLFLMVGFEVSAPAITGAGLSVSALAVDDGAANVTEFICSGGSFQRPAFVGDVAWNGCGASGGTQFTFSDIVAVPAFQRTIDTTANGATAFPPTSFIGVAQDISIGGITGGAQLHSFTSDFVTSATAIPEPSTALLSLAGPLAACCLKRRICFSCLLRRADRSRSV